METRENSAGTATHGLAKCMVQALVFLIEKSQEGALWGGMCMKTVAGSNHASCLHRKTCPGFVPEKGGFVFQGLPKTGPCPYCCSEVQKGGHPLVLPDTFTVLVFFLGDGLAGEVAMSSFDLFYL